MKKGSRQKRYSCKKMKLKKINQKGFTLVEIIVVLVILALLIGALVPSLIGFINEAQAKKYLPEVRQIYIAAQGAVTEQCAVNSDFEKSATQFKLDGKKAGRVSNNMLAEMQENNGQKQPGILIAYTKDGSIMFVEFGYEGYLIHFEDEKATITKNGKFTDGPK